MNQERATSLLSEFDGRFRDYEALNIFGQRLLTDLLKIGNLQVLSVTGRVKDRASLAEKLLRPGKHYDNLQQVTDVIGLRIVTFFEDDVDRVASLIAKEFNLIPQYCSDKRNFIEPDRFGYRSLHYVCKLSDTRRGLPENVNYCEEMFEIQIRSILQHAWAEIEHDLGYKNADTIPNKIKRQLSRVASLLEIADRDFREARDLSREYIEKVALDVKKNELSTIELNLISYLEFIGASQIVQDLDEFIRGLGYAVEGDADEDFMVEILRDVGIHSVEQLKANLEQYDFLLRNYVETILTDPSEGSVSPALSIFHLAQIVALKEGGVDGLSKFYEDHGISGLGTPQESALDTAETIRKIEER
jgi:putative GTP pyrophosphokinase